STFAGNSATGGAARGGAVANQAGSTLIVRDDTFTDNAATGSAPGDPSGVYGGAIANGGTASILRATIVRNTASDPNSGVADNGGPTPTIAPLAGSPVIDAGTSSPVLSSDQRGLSRTGGISADIGAYETGAPLVVTSTADSGPGSLRAAVSALAGYAGAMTIV